MSIFTSPFEHRRHVALQRLIETVCRLYALADGCRRAGLLVVVPRTTWYAAGLSRSLVEGFEHRNTIGIGEGIYLEIVGVPGVTDVRLIDTRVEEVIAHG